MTAPWVTSKAAGLVFDGLVGRKNRREDLDVRIVYRLKGVDDLTTSDLEALDRLTSAGCSVRYSNRLHAKLVVVDDDHAVVSSSNLTSTAGYSITTGDWQNQELGLHVQDRSLVADLAVRFEDIWESAHVLSDATVGIVLDETSAHSFRVACMRAPVVGEFVSVGEPPQVIGQVRDVSSFNPTVTAEAGEGEARLGLRGGGGGRRSQVPGVETLFSHPSKTHAFLMAQTFVQASAVYQIADVEVLKQVTPGGVFSMSTTAVEPGEVVTTADPKLLGALISGTQTVRVEVGTLRANPEVTVSFDRLAMLRLHTAILGMTGSGKSNAVKVMLQQLLDPVGGHPKLRVVVVDTHDEYDVDGIGDPANRHRLAVRFQPCALEEVWVRRAALGGPQTGAVLEEVEAALETIRSELEPTAPQLADALMEAREDASAGMKKKLGRLAEAVRHTANLCLDPTQATTILDEATGLAVDFGEPGMYVLNLKGMNDYVERTRHGGAVARAIFGHAKAHPGDAPALLVVDEAQDYIPEQQTGRLASARASFEPILEIATEGRKFGCGLLLASQRPARVNNDVLSQCNTQLIFRMVNVEDLDAVKDCFEAASAQILEGLPSYDTGVCYASGVALSMGTQVRFPEFAPARQD